MTDTDEAVYRFAKAEKDSGFTQLADDPLCAILAVCIASQQSAGFGTYLDVRRADCPECGAPGFNNGWGAFRFACTAQILTGGTMAEPCPDAPDPERAIGERE